jgi:hypothetical protein
MHIHHHLHKLPHRFCVDVFSKHESYFEILVDILHFYLKYKEEHIICITLEHSAYNIHKAVEAKIADTDRLYFIDAISVFKGMGLPYRNFEAITSPHLVNDIWASVEREVQKRINIDKEVVVVLYYMSSLLEYIDINHVMMFLRPLIERLKQMKASIVMISGVHENHTFKQQFHGLVDEVIEI